MIQISHVWMLLADTVAKVVWQEVLEIPRASDALLV